MIRTFCFFSAHTLVAKSTLRNCIKCSHIPIYTSKFYTNILSHNHDIFKNFRLKFIQSVKDWDFLKVATFLWSLLWLLNGLPYNSLPPPPLKKEGMRLKTKWLKTELSTSFWSFKTELSTSFWSFKMSCKDIVTV